MSWYCPMCEEVLQNGDVTGGGRCKDCGSKVETYNDHEDED